MTTEALTESTTNTRLLSLDVFRGLTIAGMVLVNNPGSWANIYWPLEHAEWNGWTPTDLIFPFFLFIVGVAIPLGLGQRVERGDKFRKLFLKIVYRTLVIFALGEFLAGFPYFHLSTIRIPGVLQRIAVCYFFAALIYLKTRPRTQALIALALLVVYCLLMKYVPVPGYGSGDLSKVGSLASYIDRSVFGPHIWKQGVVFDPEGLLSTMGALATTLLGVLTGNRLRCETRTPIEKVAGMFIAGACCVAIGWIWNAWFPINKSLWTSSYVFFTGGLALQLFALCYWLIDIKGYRAWAKPFVVFGVNAIALFVGTGIMARLMGLIRFSTSDGKGISLHGWTYQHLFLSWAQPTNASLAFAIVFILLWLGLMWILYQRRIVIKI
ncbi:MAG: Heparan-alpha-glucosaminide N-acetyltransferase [Acidobacteria bacterium]|nr:Heparan-alpha-glucosaminide N-acetyltransferase [Acidobacteriota bacterium]